MPKQTDGSHFDEAFYLDVAQAGGLSPALQAEFDIKSQPWRAQPAAAPS